MNQWTHGSSIQWVSEPTNHWIIESKNQGTNGSMKFAKSHPPDVLRSPGVFLWFRSAKHMLWNANQALATGSCALSALNGTMFNVEPLRRPQEPHYTKKRVSRWEFLHPWIHTFPNCSTSQLFDDGWLTWLCGWHDGGNAALTMTIVRSSEVFQLNFLWMTMWIWGNISLLNGFFGNQLSSGDTTFVQVHGYSRITPLFP